VSAPLSASAPRILVLDQDAAVRQSLCFSLSLEGYRVEPFGDPVSFGGRLDDAEVDAVIIGHTPPLIQAPDLVRRVRARSARTAVLLTATHPTAELARLARQDRVALIEKPLLGDALLRTLETALAR
jgi:DNA-binding NtrC family response regulator